MMNSMKIFTLLILTLMISACSKTPGKTSAKLNIISGNFAAILSTKANNGLFFYGRSNDGKVFTKRIDSDSVDLVFPNGAWNFYAISYESGSPTTPPNFTGKTYCGKASANFNGTDATVQIDLTNAGCNDPAFSNNVKYFSAEYKFPTPKIFTCKNLGNITSTTSCDNINPTYNKGYATSYRITVYEAKNFGDPAAPVKVADSGCFRAEFNNTAASLYSGDSSSLFNMHIPTNFSAGLNMQLEVFYGSGSPGTNAPCDGSLGVDLVSLGDPNRVKPVISSGTSQAFDGELYVKSDVPDVCQGPRLGASNFAGGFGTTGSPYAICTKGQLDLLRTSFSTYKSYSFDLLTDIDYGLTKIAPIGQPLIPLAGGTQDASVGYGGTSGVNSAIFDGHNHKISNFIIDCLPAAGTVPNNHLGFFRKINDATVKGLTFNNAVIMCDNGGDDVGVLAGEVEMTSGSSISDIKVHGHGEGNQRIGGLIGSATNGTLDLTNIHVKGDFGGSLSVGGIVGRGNTTLNITKSSFYGAVDGNKHGGGSAVVSNVGGVVGLGQTVNLNQVVVKAKRIEGSTTVGGFVGSSLTSLSINDAYVEGVLRASGMTDGSSSFTNLGGAVGLMTSGNFVNVLATNIIKSSNRGQNDHSYGGLVGGGSASTCPSGANSYYFGDNDSFYLSCGVSYSVINLKTRANFPFPVLARAADWNISSSPSFYSEGSCTVNGEYHEVISTGTATNFSGTPVLAPTDIILCNGSTYSIVHLAGRGAAFSSYTWFMPDEGKDTPRLTFEAAVEDQVPYLKRPCTGHYTGETSMGSGSAADPFWVCDQTQFANMNGGGSTYYALKSNIFSDGTNFPAINPGKFLLDGNGFGLYNFNLLLPANPGTNLNYGIFSTLNSGSVIKNLDLIGSKLTSVSATTAAPIIINAGLLAGENQGLISNVNAQVNNVNYEFTSAYVDTLRFGGLVGYNSIAAATIEKSQIDIETHIFKGDYSLTSTFVSGAVVARNDGTVNGVRSHSSLVRVLPCTSAELLTIGSKENLGTFIGVNTGSVSEVSSEGEFGIQGHPSGSCPSYYTGPISPFIVSNSGTISDFKVRPYIWLSNSMAPKYIDLVLNSTGSIDRGIIDLDGSDTFSFIRGQNFAYAGNWDANTSPAAVNSSTPVCDSTSAGSYLNVISSYGSTSFGPVSNTDVVFCNGSQNVLVSGTYATRLRSAPVSMSNVLFIARDNSCTHPGFTTSATCVADGGSWSGRPALPVGGSCLNGTDFNQTDCTTNASAWTPAAPTRFYDTDLKFSVASGNLVVKKGGSALAGFNGSGWSTATDFFNPGTAKWLLNFENGAIDTFDSPDLVKTEGNLEQLGPVFN
jgi:hypothetical protein